MNSKSNSTFVIYAIALDLLFFIHYSFIKSLDKILAWMKFVISVWFCLIKWNHNFQVGDIFYQNTKQLPVLMLLL
jgi:hypothetical protein